MHNYYPADFSPSHMGYPLSNTSSNKYVYIKQNFLPAPQERQAITKVLVNPLFNKKVFVNPNYRPTSSHIPDTTSEHMPVANKIHINPRIHTIKPPETTTRKILINPKVLRNIPATPHENPIRPVDKSLQPEQLKSQVKMINPSPKSLVTADRFAQPALKRIRRLSVRSKFKIVRSHSMSKENNNFKKQVDLKVKYYPPTKLPAANKFKLDNRRKNTTVTPKRAKFIFVNKFTSIRDVAKSIPLKVNKNNKSKSLNLLNISGVIYKNSPFSLRRTSPLKLKRSNSKIQDKPICKSKYKLIRKKGPTVEKKSPVRCVRRSMKIKKNVSVEKLRKCNIPCLYYQRFGKCKRKDIGKCNKKHDPDQIALCTKFLQGACVDDNCLLSHNVSSEKMPTCKFYLEGTCSKDQCPYLHVRINPKADICRDFLEGFCRKAQECDKRHQFLCPDYEKKGCAKPRCPYPHGKMVRKYSVVDKHKFAKKSSVSTEEKPREKPLATSENKDIKKLSKIENAQNENVRYYLDTKNVNEGKSSGESNSCVVVCNETVCDKETSFRSRPKLGDLPSFIAFDET